MRKPMLAGLLALCCVLSSSAQDEQTRLETFLGNFEKAQTLSVKLKVLQDSMRGGIQDMGPLYLRAVEYVNGRSAELDTDALLRQMALLASELAAESKHLPAAEPLWMLFEAAEDPVVRSSILEALGVLAADRDAIVARMEAWLAGRNALRQRGSARRRAWSWRRSGPWALSERSLRSRCFSRPPTRATPPRPPLRQKRRSAPCRGI